MKILLSWLNEYGDFGDPTDAAAVERVAAALTSLGLEVESIDRVGDTVDGVVTARILRLESHPDAAKVQRVYVDAGDGTELHVWCGADNISVDDIVPLATLGTAMPNGMTIERRGILGIDSEGMLCSAQELGLGEDHSGIRLLPSGTPLGVPYGEALNIQPDVLIDANVTRNRPDCWGYVGIARDLAAKLGVEFRPPTPTLHVTGAPRSAPVELLDPARCPRFTSTVISGVEVKPSADWMASRLTAAGMRPINNVVDVSNYVMLELNQPNHAYDLDTLGGGGFRVRRAADGEHLVTLDGEDRTFGTDDLLICDANDTPIGLGGVMGGLDSEISDSTTTVALEMAWFDLSPIGKTVTRTGLRSEASQRFERGVDPHGMPTAIARFVELLGETCPGLTVHDGAIDERDDEHLPPAERYTEVRIANVNRILGTSLTADDLPAILDPIGYTVSGTGDTRTVVLPTWRLDSTAEIDVIEEIARHYGYDRLGASVPKSIEPGGLTARQQRRRLVRSVLLGLGVSEAMPNPFLAPDTLAKAGLPSEAISITNPLVTEESVLRTSLRPGLLRAIAYNESHRRTGARFFEIGHVYPPSDGELPAEYEALTVVLAGEAAPAALQVWRELTATLGGGARIDQSKVPPGLHATRSATLQAGKQPLGAVGEVAPDVLAAFDVTERVAILEIDLDQFLAREPKPVQWKATSRQPSSDLDLAFKLPDSIAAEKLDKAIRQGAGKLLVDLDLFDNFRGVSVGADARSLAFRLRLQAPDRSLTDADIADVRRGVEAAAIKLGAELRS
ncbi:phenylalanine--tRNA ligase subunit beta [Ilumatobacter coccineus]|uniref:Phenylalanine--tRNA ligase beta subunit n=1 Tax=Ilumatobacter coccineus (strain NBRC 103263 / KCTC 29153 / YM16-304) TaxID=1313172 RepID=A0A6C7EEI1_ILUCY|nr:phenylalanine--tRNA ligase subunit beta [Ilumatobacter coccineus]BAN02386.1 phenylalanyl-tRNA synthetase beta chain [Ilumatobacter coccineus YM16-304]